MKNNTNKIICKRILSAIVLIACIQIVSATPPIPESYWGYATLNGVPAPDGTSITVEVYGTGEVVGNTIVQYPNGGYSLDIIFNDTDTGEDEGANKEDALTWKINEINCSIPAPGTDTAISGGINGNFNLTATISDITAPIISNVENTEPTTDSVTISWITDEESDSVVKYGTTSGSYTIVENDNAMVSSHSISLTGLSAQTTYYYVVNSTDASGNAGEVSEVSFTTATISDITLPVISNVTNTEPTTDSVTISWITDENSDSVVKYGTTPGNYTIVENDTAMVSSHSISLTGLSAETTYYYVVSSTDASDNAGEGSEFSFTTATISDITPLAISNVTNTEPTTDSVTISWITDEESDSVVKYGTTSGSYTIVENDTAMVSSHSISLTGLSAETTYYYVVNSTDASGNAGEGSEFSFTTATISDITAPIISNVENTEPTTDSVTISWITDEESDSVVKYGTTSGNYTIVENDTAMVSSHSISLTGLSAQTTYYYVVNSTDASGNAGEGSEVSFTTATISDITLPVISNVTNTEPTTDSVTISWDTDEESDSVVKYGTISGNYTNIEYDATLVSLHSISLTGLNATTTYYYVVNSTDASGNAGEGSEVSFTTATISDITAPIISNVENTEPTTDSVTISWITDEDSNSVVKYGTTSGNYTNIEYDTSLVSSHSISLTGLNATTTYYYVVNSTDASGNTGEGSEVSFTTATIPDITPPAISNVTNTEPTTDSVTISWDTDENSDSVVKYGTTPGNYTIVENDTAMVSSHSISLTGLSAETTYYYVVNSTDASGNAGEGSEFSFTTATISDITAPIISNVENTEPTTDSVTISWITDEDSDSVVKYGTTSGNYTNIEYDATLVSLHSISLTGLSAETTYYYVVNSTDASGNAGEGSEFSFTTATISDITAPIISNVENTEPTTDSVTISWITDEDSDSVVRYGTTPGNYTIVENDTAMVRSHSVSLSELSAETTYYYMVYSTDASSNSGEDGEYYFTTTATSTTTIRIGDAIAAPNGYALTSIMVYNVTDLGSGNVDITFDPSVVHVIDVTSGDGNALTVQDWNVDNTAGTVDIAAWDADEPHNGDVVFAHLTLHSVGDHLSSTTLAISSAELTNYYTYEPITHTVTNGTLDIIAPVVIIDNVEAASGEYTTALVMVNNASNLGSGSITVTYNSSVVHVTSVTSGDEDALVVQDWNADNTAGSVTIAAWDADESHNGNLVFANVTFHAVGEYPDSTPLDISSSELIDYTSYGVIGHSVTSGTFSIIDNEPPVITDAIATSDVILNDNGRPRIPGTGVTVLNATVLDSESGVVNVTINLSSIGGSDDQVMERIAGTDIWTVAANATDGINLTHELVVTASDGANNTNTSVIGLTVLLRGDVVRDGDVNSADALYIAKYLVGKEPMPSLLVSDMQPAEGDGKITSADALYLAKYLVGKEVAP